MPILNPASTAAPGTGPLVASDGRRLGRRSGLERTARRPPTPRLTAAETADRPVALLGLSGEPADIVVGTASRRAETLRKLILPQPVIRDRASHLPAITRFAGGPIPGSDIVWLVGRLETGNGRAFADALAEARQ